MLFRVPGARIDLWNQVGAFGTWEVVQDPIILTDYWIRGTAGPADSFNPIRNALLRLLPLYGPFQQSYIQAQIQTEFDFLDLPDERGVSALMLGNMQVDGRGYVFGAGYETIDDDQPTNSVGFLSQQPVPIYSVATEVDQIWNNGDGTRRTPIGLDYNSIAVQQAYMDTFIPATVTAVQTDLDSEVGTVGLMVRGDDDTIPARSGWAQFRNITITRDKSVTVDTLTAGQFILIGTFNGAIRVTAAEVAGTAVLDLSPRFQPADFIQVWAGDPDAGGNLVMEWTPNQKVWGGDLYEWDAAGFDPEDNVSTAPPSGLLEQVNFNLPIAGWGRTEIPGTGVNYTFSRSITNVRDNRSISLAVAFLTIMDAIGDPFDLVLYEAVASEGFFGGTALNSLRIDGPNGLADVAFQVPVAIVNLIGNVDAKQYELKVIDSSGRLDLIERGIVRCTADGLTFTALNMP
jgi:hypothetical protein